MPSLDVDLIANRSARQQYNLDVHAGIRIALTILCAIGFGVFVAFIKGQNADDGNLMSQIRFDLGNLSAPWLALALIVGMQDARRSTGALLGLLATVSALVGFYLATSIIVDLGGDGFAYNLTHELWANRIYFGLAVPAGLIFGMFGSALPKVHWIRAADVAGALMVGEPIAFIAIGTVVPSTFVGNNAITFSVHAGELFMGVLIVGVARFRQALLVSKATA
jgi:Family of unknown function (DUF6518)